MCKSPFDEANQATGEETCEGCSGCTELVQAFVDLRPILKDDSRDERLRKNQAAKELTRVLRRQLAAYGERREDLVQEVLLTLLRYRRRECSHGEAGVRRLVSDIANQRAARGHRRWRRIVLAPELVERAVDERNDVEPTEAQQLATLRRVQRVLAEAEVRLGVTRNDVDEIQRQLAQKLPSYPVASSTATNALPRSSAERKRSQRARERVAKAIRKRLEKAPERAPSPAPHRPTLITAGASTSEVDELRKLLRLLEALGSA